MSQPAARRLAALVAVAAVALGTVSSAQAARRLQLGFFDSVYSRRSSERDPWLDRTVALGANIVRIDIGWPAPNTATRPPGFDARDPADPHYDFSQADASIEAASARGLQVLVSFTGAPQWVDGSGRPAGVTPGTWKPSVQALDDYGAALARRYSGTFPDPAQPGAVLPRAKAFQVWNEPNIAKYLNPQWNGGQPASPALYRSMLNGFYRGVKSVDPNAIVVTAGTGPFGDPRPGGNRIQPARFWRDLLCLKQRNGRLRASSCPDPAHFDVLSHHPYSVGPPRRKALNADDVTIPDIGKLTRLLRRAEDSGRARPRKRHPVWITEISFDSDPPDPQGVPEATHARWLEETLYLLWRQGVDTVLWYLIRDQPPVPSFAATSQSGVFLQDGRAKLAATAYRFPFVSERAGHGRLRVWGRAPLAGPVTIERRQGGTWHALRVISARRGATFFLQVPQATVPDRLRARVAGQTSLTWTQR